ncbi:GH92 family glycosyl hydrolase [Prolixibacter denitrificans]|nr:GH92 family glycosyl hydrolase [Prolixibacter denitrificans]PSK81110.1 putative alpha-1,2-mannosidase [Prolixibacter denitrificans]
MKILKGWLIGIFVLMAGCVAQVQEQGSAVKSPVDYVNPYMGNISHLLVPTYPTIHLPNSLLRVYPERADYTSVRLHGLPLEVTSHRGVSAFNLSPFQENPKDVKPVISFSYDQEKITPYSYSVYLDEAQIDVDFAVSHQSAMYALKFEQQEAPGIILNSLNGGMKWDGKAISGWQLIGNDTRVFLYLVPNEKPENVSVLKDGKMLTASDALGKNACLVLNFPKGKTELQVHYGISFISAEQAEKNLKREVAGKTVAEIQAEGRKIWNEALGKIEVQGGTENERTVFYTSLYRCYERPVCISEDGRYYSAFDHRVHSDNGRPFYTDDWIWDSYRALHPLRILVNPERENDILHSFVLMAEQMPHMWMPTFPEITGDSRRMNSNHGVASVLDAYRKGLHGFDLEKAFEACKKGITEKTLAPWSGKPAGALSAFYQKHGYIPALKPGEKEMIPEVNSFERRQAVAVTLGTAYDEWCLSQLADTLGKEADATRFLKASFNYRNLYNPETQFFHPKDAEGKFIEPFDYRFSGGVGVRDYYDENNGWTYRWDVQHNIPDLIHLMGGKKAFAQNLDALFTTPMGRGKREFYTQLPDQTGNVGQFTMANEPSLHIPYLYNYAGQPWKTQKLVRALLHEWFRNDLMGVPGDEDGGGLSSFVVFSSMGFYPVTPGKPVYSIGSPLFTNVKIHLANGKTFELEAKNTSDENKYIQSATLNGKPLDEPVLNHSDLMNGAKLVLVMGNRANRNWGAHQKP